MTQSEHLKPIPRVSLTDTIVERLTNFIIESDLEVGDKLPSERELAERLGVGRSSLREAIKVLETLGAVEVMVGEGMFVARGDRSVLAKPLSWSVLLSESSLREVMEARRIIEVELAGLAAERGSEEAIAAIAQTIPRSNGSLDDQTPHKIRDVEFHLAVAKAAGNNLLYHVLNTLHQMLHAMLAEIARTYGLRVQPGTDLSEITRVYEAIRAHDVQAARQAMEVHLCGAEARLPALPPNTHSEQLI